MSTFRKIAFLSLICFSKTGFADFSGKLGLKLLGNVYPQQFDYTWVGAGGSVYAVWASGFSLDFEYDYNRGSSSSVNQNGNISNSGEGFSSFTLAPGMTLTKESIMVKGALKVGVMGSEFAVGPTFSADWIVNNFTVGLHGTYLTETKKDPASFYSLGVGAGYLF